MGFLKWGHMTYCLGVWYAGSTAEDRKAVQRVINTAQKIIGCPLTSLEHIATSCCLRRTKAITGDPTHPAYPLFDLLPSGRHYRSTKFHTSRLTYSFFPWVIRITNTNGYTHKPSLLPPTSLWHLRWLYIYNLFIFILLFVLCVAFFFICCSGAPSSSLYSPVQ